MGDPTIEEKYDTLKKRYDSLVQAIQKLELAKASLEHDNQVLRNQLLNADQQIGQQKANLVNVITSSNQQQQDMAQEIAVLKSDLKVAGNGNYSQLGN